MEIGFEMCNVPHHGMYTYKGPNVVMGGLLYLVLFCCAVRT